MLNDLLYRIEKGQSRDVYIYKRLDLILFKRFNIYIYKKNFRDIKDLYVRRQFFWYVV